MLLPFPRLMLSIGYYDTKDELIECFESNLNSSVDYNRNEDVTEQDYY